MIDRLRQSGPSASRGALLGAVSGVATACLLALTMTWLSVPPGAIEAEAFAMVIDGPTPAVGSVPVQFAGPAIEVAHQD